MYKIHSTQKLKFNTRINKEIYYNELNEVQKGFIGNFSKKININIHQAMKLVCQKPIAQLWNGPKEYLNTKYWLPNNFDYNERISESDISNIQICDFHYNIQAEKEVHLYIHNKDDAVFSDYRPVVLGQNQPFGIYFEWQTDSYGLKFTSESPKVWVEKIDIKESPKVKLTIELDSDMIDNFKEQYGEYIVGSYDYYLKEKENNAQQF